MQYKSRTHLKTLDKVLQLWGRLGFSSGHDVGILKQNVEIQWGEVKGWWRSPLDGRNWSARNGDRKWSRDLMFGI